MGEFKPMVKMETTEPSVELKLKKGGSVGHKCMKKGGKADASGHKMMDGGMAPTIGAPRGGLAPAMAPKRPTLASRRRAVAVAPTLRKEGGKIEEKESKSEAKAEMKAGKGKNYATGGVVKGQGGYATGGVVKGQGGYAKGGATKKFASGGSVQDDGRAQKMPQGNKKPSAPVSINKLSGTFKKGGKVKKFADGGSDSAYADVMAREKPSYDESFESPKEQLSRMRMRKNIERGLKATSDIERESNEGLLKSITNIPSKLKDLFRGQGAVTDTEKTISRTVVPAKKRGGKVK